MKTENDEKIKGDVNADGEMDIADSVTISAYVANSELKSLPELKKANKIGLYNTNVKSIKKSIKAEIEKCPLDDYTKTTIQQNMKFVSYYGHTVLIRVTLQCLLCLDVR